MPHSLDEVWLVAVRVDLFASGAGVLGFGLRVEDAWLWGFENKLSASDEHRRLDAPNTVWWYIGIVG